MIKYLLFSTLFLFYFSFASIDEILNFYKKDFEDIENLNKIKSTILNNREYALSSYLALKVASFLYYKGDYEEGYSFLNLADSDAFINEDIPYYLYIKGSLEKKLRISEYLHTYKYLSTNFCYSYYGYKVYLEIYPFLSEQEKYKIIDNCLKHKHFEKVKNMLFSLTDTNAVYYYLIKISKNKEEKISYFNSISKNSEFYPLALKIVANLKEEYEKDYIYYLLGKNDTKDVLDFYYQKIENAFFNQNYDDFLKYLAFYESFDGKSPDILWLKFLYSYKLNEIDTAKILLKQYSKYTDDIYKIEYWKAILYNQSINNITLKDSYKYSEITPYLSLILYKTGKSINLIKENQCISYKKEFDYIKNLDYKLAWIEANYQIKKGFCKEVYRFMPEVAVKCFNQNSDCSYIKPFGKIENYENLIYAIMKQESFFNPYAISLSNAVGLTQFIPKTAFYVAKQKNFNDFDMVELYKPQNAISFALWYIDKLYKMFNGNVVYISASYNSGENAVKRFLEKNSIKDEGEFIEFYPFSETRNYVKKVLKNYIIYLNQ